MSFQNILVPVDGSSTSYAAVDKAVEFAKAFNSKITLVQVLALDPYIAAEYISASQTNDLIERARGLIALDELERAARFVKRVDRLRHGQQRLDLGRFLLAQVDLAQLVP